MKILLVTPMPPQPQASGAIPVVLHALLTGLTPRHQVSLVTIIGTESGEREAVEHLRLAGHDVQAFHLMKSSSLQRWRRRWRLASTWLLGPYPWRTVWFWEPEIQRHLDRLLAEQQFDLIIVEDSSMGIYRYETKTPTLFTEHEVRRPRPVNWHMGRLPADWLRWIFLEVDWQRWRIYQPAVWHRFNRIQVFSPRDAAAIHVLAPGLASRVRVNPFGIDLPTMVDPNFEEKGFILFVGNFTHRPNVDAALWLGREIMPLLRKRSANVRLTLVGKYPPKSVQTLACADIHVAGFVPELGPYVAQASVVVAPLRIGGGMRMKVLQAMALGKAVVTTPRGSDGLAMNGQQTPLVIAETAEGIAEAAALLLADDNARRELGRRARAYVAENYSAQAYAQRLEAIYEEMCDTG